MVAPLGNTQFVQVADDNRFDGDDLLSDGWGESAQPVLIPDDDVAQIDADTEHDPLRLGRRQLGDVERRRDLVRLDQSRATDPLGPCTMRRENGRAVVQCAATTRAVFPELNDDMPKGTVLWRARFVDLGHGGTIPRDSSGDCRIAGPHGELTHDGIDHVLISDALKRRLSADSLTMRVRNYSDDAGAPLQAGTTTALPSDHCPHVVVWTPRP